MASATVSHSVPINAITGAIVNSAMRVHSTLGPGLLESAYQARLAHELRNRGLEVAVQVPLPVVYEGQKLEVGYRLDLVVENRVVVEVKSVELIHRIHEAQLLSYMRLSRIPIGLLINFNVLHLRDGIKRIVDGRDWEKESSVSPCAPCGESGFALPLYRISRLQNFAKNPKKFLHLWKIPVISLMRTNFAEMPGNPLQTREPREEMSSSHEEDSRETRW